MSVLDKEQCSTEGGTKLLGSCSEVFVQLDWPHLAVSCLTFLGSQIGQKNGSHIGSIANMVSGASQSGSRIHEERALIRIGIGRVLAWESPAVTGV
jgi:hypothetical protein